MYYIIYEITNKINDKKYIGCHKTKNLKDNYMGSSKYLQNSIKKHGIENFEKIILHFCETEEDMLKKERELVNENIVKSDIYYNLTLGGNSFYHINNNLDKYRHHFQNKVIVKTEDDKILKVDKNDEKYQKGEYTSFHKNMMICKDRYNNYYWVNVNDKRFKNGELVGVNKGLVMVKDSNDKMLLVSSSDKRIKSGELNYLFTGKKHTEESKKKIGEKNSLTQKGNKNSQFNTSWVYSIEKEKSIKIKKNELEIYLKNGWIKGRKIKW